MRIHVVSNLRKLTLVFTALSIVSSFGTGFAESVQIVKVRDFRQNELYCKAFQVSKPTSIHIYSVGAAQHDEEYMAGYAWIIPSESLEPIWTMDDNNTDYYGDSDFLREYDSNLELEPGTYEVYYYAGLPYKWGSFSFNFDWDELKDALEEIKKELAGKEEDLEELERQLRDNNWRVNVNGGMTPEMEEILAEYSLEITGDNSAINVTSCSYQSKRVAAEILHPDHNEYTSIGFSVTKPLDVEVQCIGEVPNWSDTYADYGWIINADTREREWSMTDEQLQWAGGAEKNKMAQRTLRLAKGNYLLYYVTDDSHSYDDWNSPPPYNPEAYGVRVSVLNESDRSAIQPYKESQSQMALLSIVRAGDDFLEIKPFRVKDECDVRIYALGEYSTGSGEFADYAWIEREGDSRPFWLMRDSNTEPAGGAQKNRLADQVLTLPKGDYVLGYMTDDSHAYGSWNSSPPYDQKNYGVTLFAVNDRFDRSVITELQSESVSEDVIARITRVGDDAEESVPFTIDKPSQVQIIAVGEGKDNEMYDYGWIEDVEKDDVIWEMTYRKTRPAGGADKNRMVDTQIYLDAGRYRLYYVSDGSHSFGNWNAQKPRNPQYWGITVLRSE